MSVRIMIAVHNGSPVESSMDLATRWAQRLGGSIVALGIVDESNWAPAPVLPSGDAPLNQTDNALNARAAAHVQQSLRQLREHCRQAGVEYSQIKEGGSTCEQILAEAQRHDVILFGKATTPDPGLGVPSRSILDNVLRHSPRPVVTVPGSVDDGQGILVAYDGSLQAARALQALVASGLTALGNIRILSIDEKSEETANKHARRAAEYLNAHDIDAKSETKVTDKAVEDVVVEEARRQSAEMIVMGAYGRSRLAEFFLGSVTSHVIDESPVPVFLFH
jgi:nucleotide-binding universal stress UspA family protein